MATSALISVKQAPGIYLYIRVHWDAPEVLKHLQASFNTGDRANAVVSLGDLSSLEGPNLNRQCIAYHRDREELWERSKPRTASCWKGLMNSAREACCQYMYCFDGGTWISTKISL